MSRLADEAAYFGAVQDGVDSQQDLIESLKQQLAAFRSAVEHVTEDGCTGRSFVAMPEGWAMVHKDRLNDLELTEEQLSEAQAEALEQARIVGMGGEREIALRQKLDIVSSLLREAAGRMSYGHWSTEFRERVERSLKTKAPKQARIVEQVILLRNQVLEECAAIAEDTAAGRDAEAIADAIRARSIK